MRGHVTSVGDLASRENKLNLGELHMQRSLKSVKFPSINWELIVLKKIRDELMRKTSIHYLVGVTFQPPMPSHKQ
jgi:hypothetical protein